ncbi:acyltransferase family protein [Sphingomonas crusticola]|uniref:acyltransferase family protein n=1 Tax=Sphingomonas crusticola TaxID=1697973 RepID=UPI000E277141|nr:heparan-alpha-glucosaminide N-acetyltransferase domain-containing protein [Sphingomonas crusticola]
MTKRLIALDALRGLAVAGMILANSPGSWSLRYAQLDHAPWNGFTATDMVFPTFLFSVGIAVGLSFPRPLADTDKARSWSRLARRTLALIALGLALNLLAGLSLAHLRIPGILQRIGLCYAIGAGLVLLTARRRPDGLAAVNLPVVLGVIGALLIGYWALLTFVPVPGFGAGHLDPEGNLAAFIDRGLFTIPHLWPYGTDAAGKVVYDPEGLLSTLPATVNLLIGILAGCAWKRASHSRTAFGLAGAGLLLIVAGLLIDPAFPINKRIWTSSFALLSSGVSMVLFALLSLAFQSKAARAAAYPLRVLGGNATLAFVLSVLLGIFSTYRIFKGGTQTAQAWGMEIAQKIIPDPMLASLACSIAILALITALIWPLHRRAIHWRL